MRPLTLAVCVALSGCDFKVNIPADAVIECTPNQQQAACPANYFCQPTLRRCLPAGTTDREAPRLLRSTVSATRLRRGASLEVSLDVSEPLAAPPAVVLLQGASSWAVPVVESFTAEGRYRLTWAWTDEAAEGDATLLVTLVDVAGNESAGLPVSVVTFDFTPPAVTELRYLTPRDADAGVTQVRPSESMSVRLTVSEPVKPGVRLVQRALDCVAPEVTWTLLANRDGVLDFSRGPSPVDTTCTWALALTGLEDLAGNPGVSAALSPTFHVNGVAPTVGNLTLYRVEVDGGRVPGRSFSHQPGYARLEARFDVEPSAEGLVASFDDEQLTDCALTGCTTLGDAGRSCACGRDVRAGDLEGTHVIAVQLTDGAGNQRTAASSLRFDFTAPSLVPGTAQVFLEPKPGCPLPAVRALGVGGSARVVFSLDEPASQTPVVETAAPSHLAFTYESGAATGFSFSHVLVSAAEEGRAPVQVQVVDEAGNVALLGGPDGGLAVVVDRTAPAALPVGAPDAIVFARAPWGDATGRPRFAVSGVEGAVEPGVTVRVLADADAGFELGSALATADGGFVATMSNLDRTEAFVAAVDPACNEGPVARVLDVAWTATVQGRVPGVAFPNPHALEAWPDFAGEAARPDAEEPVDVGLAGVLDGRAVTTQARSLWSPLDGVATPARAFTTLAYDAARQRVVFFGGYTSPTLDRFQDTWEFGPDAWSEMAPLGALPPAGNGHATSYDPRRRRVVMHGGITTNGTAATVWEWDGTAWANRTPTGPQPEPRDSHALAWDGNSQRLILFGGTAATSAGSALRNDTWAWNGVSWTQLALTGPAPSPRYNHTLTWDPVHHCLWLFGGITALGPTNPANYSNELWQFDGTSWSQVPVSGTWPSTRQGQMAAYDSVRHVVVYFGGIPSTGAANETWEWDGAAWTRRTPPLSPPARYGGDLVFHEGRGRAFLFGGYGSSAFADTWEFDGTTWKQLGAPSQRPGPRYATTMVYEPSTARVILHGGMTGTGAPGSPLVDYGDTWAWTGASWTNLTDGGPSPSNRGYPAMAWDPTAQRIVLHGGYRSVDAGLFGDTWEWDGTSWLDGGVAVGGPGRLVGHQLATNPVTGQVVLMGGYTGALTTAALWARVDGGWEALDAGVGGGPGGRSSFAWAFDPLGQQLLAYGGTGQNNTVRGDTWGWTGAGWREWTGVGPVPRDLASLGFDVTQQRLVLSSGSDRIVLKNETWEWDGTSWSQRLPGPRKPAPTLAQAMAWDEARGQLLRFGGRGNGNLDNSAMWTYRVAPSGKAAWAARFQLSRAGLSASDEVRGVTSRWVAGASASSGAGLSLWAWDGTTLSNEASSSASAASPGPVSWASTDAARLAALERGVTRELLFVLAPTGINGPAGRTQVAVDYVEVEVRYRHR